MLMQIKFAIKKLVKANQIMQIKKNNRLPVVSSIEN